MPQSKCILTALALLLTACSQTQVPLESNITMPAQFEQVKAGQMQNMQQWWRYWHDPQLARLIEQGLKTSPDIAIAQSRLNEARATAQLAQSDLGPTVGVGGNIGGQRSRLDNPIGEPYRTLAGQDDHINSKGYGANLGVMASWEVDIFGQKQVMPMPPVPPRAVRKPVFMARKCSWPRALPKITSKPPPHWKNAPC
ncbi:TolC family protein [Spirabiliibacterium mucosae]|uniref:TolC family protein n=1 Tax=Spirabiliibacterium mucosae TaxID=28156 RepID=UPI0031F39C55